MSNEFSVYQSLGLILAALAGAVSFVTTPWAAESEQVSVKVVPLAQLTVRPEVSAPATVVSLADSRIGAELNAAIVEIPVRVGDIVEPGGVLARLDCGDYELVLKELQARLAAAEARLGFAREQLRRARSLKKQRTMSQEQLEQREANLGELAAQREELLVGIGRAERNLGKCDLRSPFRAAVLERLASPGEYAMPGLPVIRVLDIGRLEVAANVIDGDAAALSASEAIVFRYHDIDHPLRLRVLSPFIDTATRTREARLLFIDEPALPGATGRLVWKTAAALPADLLVRRGGRLGVLIAEAEQARFYPLPGAREGRPAAIDLPDRVLVITDGRFALEDGDLVKIVE